MLCGESQLQAEEDDEPGYVNPQDAQWDEADDAIDVTIGNKLSDILSEAPFCSGPNECGEGGSAESGFGIDFCAGQDEIKQEEGDGSYYVGYDSGADIRKNSSMYLSESGILSGDVNADAEQERSERQDCPVVNHAVQEGPAFGDVPDVVEGPFDG